MDKKKAVEELKKFLSNLQKSSGTTGFKIEGKRNIAVNNYAEGFDTGFDISGEDNIAIHNEAQGPNHEKIIEKYHYLIAELDRPNTEQSKVKKIYEELKSWGPSIATVVLKILEKSGIL
jgi:hypothetical protein